MYSHLPKFRVYTQTRSIVFDSGCKAQLSKIFTSKVEGDHFRQSSKSVVLGWGREGNLNISGTC